jgi:hypothetical protein
VLITRWRTLLRRRFLSKSSPRRNAADCAAKAASWELQLQVQHPYVGEQPSDEAALRLILGVGRSGTNWISGVLAKTPCKTRFFSEPLFHLTPLLPFKNSGDHTAIGYAEPAYLAPLLDAYRLVAHRQFGVLGLQGCERNDPDWMICLVKEVHALLGSEALLDAWKSPVIFISRDPVYVIDSLFSAQTVNTIYLDHEVHSVQESAFLERFARGIQQKVRVAMQAHRRSSYRRRTIVHKLVCVQLLQRMFYELANTFGHAKLFAYEDFCERPSETFRAAAQFLSIPWDETLNAYLEKTRHADQRVASDPYSIVRDTAAQRERSFKFLSPAEVALCRSVLAAIAD